MVMVIGRMKRQVLILTTFVVLAIVNAKSSTWSLKAGKADRRHKRTCECSLVLPHSPSDYLKTSSESKTCSIRSEKLVQLRKDVGFLQKVQIGERMRCNSFAGQLHNVTSLMFELEDHAHQQETYRSYALNRMRAFSQESVQLQRLLAGQENFIKFLETRMGDLAGKMQGVEDVSRRVEALAREATDKRESTVQNMSELEERVQLAEESTQAFLWLMTETLAKIPAAERKILQGLKKAKEPIAGSPPGPDWLGPRKRGSVNSSPRKHVQIEEDYILDVTPR